MARIPDRPDDLVLGNGSAILWRGGLKLTLKLLKLAIQLRRCGFRNLPSPAFGSDCSLCFTALFVTHPIDPRFQLLFRFGLRPRYELLHRFGFNSSALTVEFGLYLLPFACKQRIE